MARAGLRWKLEDVAQRAGVSRVTVSRFELEQSEANLSTQRVIRQAFEAAGIEFRPDDSVCLCKPAEAST
jgi:transcriptional regulator with XRE-family HTH domain